MLSRVAVVAVTLSAGCRDIQGINGGAGISLGKDGVRVPVATGAGMLFAVGMDAALKFVLLVAVAFGAVNRGKVLGMWIFLDVGVAVIAFEAAVDAC
jgi:hypothetical protein